MSPAPAPPPALAALPGSRRALTAAFAAARGGGLELLPGDHRAVFVGPAWLRAAAPRGIALMGMPRWHGKRFAALAAGADALPGHNLVRSRAGDIGESLPLTARVAPSWLDGGPAIAVDYGADGPLPWRWVRDEFRPVGDGVLLGLTFSFSPRLRALALPFALVRDADPR